MASSKSWKDQSQGHLDLPKRRDWSRPLPTSSPLSTQVPVRDVDSNRGSWLASNTHIPRKDWSRPSPAPAQSLQRTSADRSASNLNWELGQASQTGQATLPSRNPTSTSLDTAQQLHVSSTGVASRVKPAQTRNTLLDSNSSLRSLPASHQYPEQTLSHGLAFNAQSHETTSMLLSPKNMCRPPLISTESPLETTSRGVPPAVELRHASNPSLSPKNWSRPPQTSTQMFQQGPSSKLDESFVRPVIENALRSSTRLETVIPPPKQRSPSSQVPSTSTSALPRSSIPITSVGKKMPSSQSERDISVPEVAQSRVQTFSRVPATRSRSVLKQVPGSAVEKTSVRTTRKSTGMPDRKIYDNSSVIKLRQHKSHPSRKRSHRRDVFIPSSLTVATLARILQMKLGNMIS